MHPTRFLLAALLAALVLATPALAQELQPKIQLATSISTLSRGPNESAVLTISVQNLGPADGTVTLNAAPVDGWRFDFVDAPTMMVQRGSQRVVMLKVLATDTAEDATLKLTGSLIESTTGRSSPPVTSEVKLTYVAPAVAAPPPPEPATPWQPFAGVGGILVLGLIVFQTGSVALELSSSRIEVTPAGSGYVRVTVRNRWWPARRVQIRVRDVPSPAVAALSLSNVWLRRGESVSVPLMVKAPVHMPDGEQSLSVQARAGILGPWMSRRRVRLTFRSPVAPDAPLEPLRPLIVPSP
jgi:hypothetical protein